MLSWKANATLTNTLDSYKYHELDKLAHQKVIFFQEISAEDSRIGREYGYDVIGSPNNIGIGAAYKQLLDYTRSDLFLFLENDWLLIEPAQKIITDAMRILTMQFPVDVVKLRHRKNPGEPLWSRTYQGREQTDGQRYLLDAIHWTDDPLKFKEIFPYEDWYLAWARNANWTNNPTMFTTRFLRENIVSRLEGDIEQALQPWWQEQDFMVAQNRTGLFTHMRLDR